mgnify:CR=1 FL=1
MRCNQISVINDKPLDIPSGPSPLDLFSFLERDKTWLLSVETSWNLSLTPEIYSWKLEPLLKGISLASCGKVIIVSVWQRGRISYWNTIQTQLLTEDPPAWREVRSLITCHVLRGSPLDSLKLLSSLNLVIIISQSRYQLIYLSLP